ncbi:hypothetical protein [Sphingomonas profundi]|uniref:hypothetical protein n=1 Tax=Alterirhizorhabdus profundi TaxID=2681549 RepID=UPI0012E84C57|nr:hypothetical protein [Sphingomonas profundi]
MAYVDQPAFSRLKPVAAVALVHLAIGYAFISGLATDVMHRVPSVFRVISIAEPVPPPPNDPEPAPPRAQPQERAVTAPVRQVETASQAGGHTRRAGS